MAHTLHPLVLAQARALFSANEEACERLGLLPTWYRGTEAHFERVFAPDLVLHDLVESATARSSPQALVSAIADVLDEMRRNFRSHRSRRLRMRLSLACRDELELLVREMEEIQC